MRWLLAVVFLVSCAPAAAAPVQTEDPQVAELTAQVDAYKDRSAKFEAAYAKAEASLVALQAAQNDWMTVWTIPQTIARGEYRTIGLQDEFTIRIRFTATAPVRVRVMDFNQYARFVYGATAAAMTYPATTDLDVVFHDAEGCGGYLLVLDAPGAVGDVVMTPSFGIIHRPTPYLTGACAP